MRLMGRSARGATVIVAFLLVASCAAGKTLPAINVTDVNATLTGRVGSTVVGDVNYWFQWGPSTAYSAVTPTQSVHVYYADGSSIPVRAMISGLAEATTYHYRLCARDAGGTGICGEDMTVTTTSGHDSVTGQGVVFSEPTLGFYIGATVVVTSNPDGTAPVGHIQRAPGHFYFRLPDEGAPGCVRVVGNRAAIGFMGEPVGFEEETDPVPILIFIEDNGPTGDRFSAGTIAAPATNCPMPTDADFVPAIVGGQFPVGPVLESGDFVVHDHPVT